MFKRFGDYLSSSSELCIAAEVEPAGQNTTKRHLMKCSTGDFGYLKK